MEEHVRETTGLLGRIVSKVNKRSDGCWQWLGAKNAKGYGIINVSYKCVLAHRVSFCANNGIDLEEIRGGFVCHHCDNPECVNPDHLYLGDAVTNQRDKESRGRVRPARGERHWRAKLNSEQVVRIRELYSLGTSQSKLGKMFGVDQTVVSDLVRRNTWRHV